MTEPIAEHLSHSAGIHPLAAVGVPQVKLMALARCSKQGWKPESNAVQDLGAFQTAGKVLQTIRYQIISGHFRRS